MAPKSPKSPKSPRKKTIFPKDCPFSLSNSTFCGSKLANLCSYDPGKSFWPFFGNFQNLTYAPHKRSNLTLSIFFLSTTIKSLQITKKHIWADIWASFGLMSIKSASQPTVYLRLVSGKFLFC